MDTHTHRPCHFPAPALSSWRHFFLRRPSSSVLLHLFFFKVSAQNRHLAPTGPYKKWLCDAMSIVTTLIYSVLFTARSRPGNTALSEGKAPDVFSHLCISHPAQRQALCRHPQKVHCISEGNKGFACSNSLAFCPLKFNQNEMKLLQTQSVWGKFCKTLQPKWKTADQREIRWQFVFKKICSSGILIREYSSHWNEELPGKHLVC